MWIMTKTVKGRDYMYLYKTVWEGGKPKSKFVRYLGSKDILTKPELKKIIKEAEEKDI